MSSGRRYKFFGSSFRVQTGFGTAKTITAITKADPAVVSAAAHGFILGDVVKLNDITGMTQVNNGVYPVDNPTTGTFELNGVDSTEYDAFTVDSPNDAEAAPVTFSIFCELTGVNQQGGGATQNDVSTICSTAREFEPGLRDAGTLQLDFNWAGNEVVQRALEDAEESGDTLAFKVTFPTDGGSIIMVGNVQQTSFQGSVGNPVWTASATIKLSGPKFTLEAV